MAKKASEKTAVNVIISLAPNVSSSSTGTHFHPSEVFYKHLGTSLTTTCTSFPYHIVPNTTHSCMRSITCPLGSSTIPTPAWAMILFSSLCLPVQYSSELPAISWRLCISPFTVSQSQESYRGTGSGVNSLGCLLPSYHGHLMFGVFIAAYLFFCYPKHSDVSFTT